MLEPTLPADGLTFDHNFEIRLFSQIVLVLSEDTLFVVILEAFPLRDSLLLNLSLLFDKIGNFELLKLTVRTNWSVIEVYM